MYIMKLSFSSRSAVKSPLHLNYVSASEEQLASPCSTLLLSAGWVFFGADILEEMEGRGESKSQRGREGRRSQERTQRPQLPKEDSGDAAGPRWKLGKGSSGRGLHCEAMSEASDAPLGDGRLSRIHHFPSLLSVCGHVSLILKQKDNHN